MIRAVLLFFITGACFNIASAQVTVSDFLLTAFEDSDVTGYDNQISFIKGRNYRIPWIDEVELRIGNDELIYEDVQYAFRLRPSNPWLVRRNNALFNATRKELTARQSIEFKDALVSRYEQTLRFLYLKESLFYSNQQLELNRKLADIFQQNPESGLFDPKDFVDAKLDVVNEIEQMDDLRLSFTKNQLEISSILGNSEYNWDGFSLIEIAQIDSISNHIAQVSLPSTEYKYILAQQEVARQETRKEKADFDIGFIQGEYFPFTNRDSEFGFCAGITIPIFKKNKPQIAERTLDELELKSDLAQQQSRDSVAKLIDFEYLKSTISHFQRLQDEVETLGLQELRQTLMQSEDYDPITLIKLEIAISKLNERLIDAKYRVIDQFIDFLFTFDAPNKQPLVNYLSKSLEQIQ